MSTPEGTPSGSDDSRLTGAGCRETGGLLTGGQQHQRTLLRRRGKRISGFRISGMKNPKVIAGTYTLGELGSSQATE